MEENIIPGIILDKSEDEGGEVSGDVNKLQARDTYFFCKKTSHQKTGNLSRKPISCFSYGKKVISHLIAEVRGETQGGKMNSKMEPENWQKWQNR